MNDSHTVEIQRDDYSARLTLAEPRPGSGLWDLQSIELASTDGSHLAPGRLRNVPFAALHDEAVAMVRQRSAATRFKRPSEIHLAPFLVDRRGKAKRTDDDFVGLALELVNAEMQSHKAALLWSNIYGGSRKTWSNRITEAKNRGLLERHPDGFAWMLSAKAANLLGLDAEEPDARPKRGYRTSLKPMKTAPAAVSRKR